MLLACILACASCDPRHPEHTTTRAPRVFGIHAVWFEGKGDENRAELDMFLECLVHGSNIHQYWKGEAQLVLRGSYALPAPESRLDWDDVSTWLMAPRQRALLPARRPGEVPLYLVFGSDPELWVGACGRNASVDISGDRVAMAIVRNHPHCWPTKDRRRTQTQIAAHEIVESVDRALGYGSCAGGGACRGKAICGDPCDTFVGLECPGAPTKTWTGCGKQQLDGWVVQKFGYAGRDPTMCGKCAPCDFTPRACLPDETGCATPPPLERP